MGAVKLVYVAGPYRGADAWAVEANRLMAREVAYRVARCGAFPVTPHLLADQALGCARPDEFWLEGDLELLRRLDAIIMCEGWEGSEGSRGELKLAESLDMPVFFDPYYQPLVKWLAECDTCSDTDEPEHTPKQPPPPPPGGGMVMAEMYARHVLSADEQPEALADWPPNTMVCPECKRSTNELRSYRCVTCRDVAIEPVNVLPKVCPTEGCAWIHEVSRDRAELFDCPACDTPLCWDPKTGWAEPGQEGD